MSSAVSVFVAIKFVKLLATPWKEWDAFKLGLIDENGRKIKNAKSIEEKSAMSIFHIMVKNIKRLLEKIPFGKSKLATYATALFLIRENMSDDTKVAIQNELLRYMSHQFDLVEQFQPPEKLIYELKSGKYEIKQGPFEGSVLILSQPIQSIGYEMNAPIFESCDSKTQKRVIFSPEDLREIK